MAITIEYTILGILALGFLYLVFHQYLYDKTPIRSVPYARGRPYFIDLSEDGYVAEIEKIEDRGQGKIRIHCDNGERRTYNTNTIKPIGIKHNIAGVGRPIYTHEPKSTKDSGELTKTTIEELETQLRRYKQGNREIIEEHLDTSRRIGEIAKPQRTGREPPSG